MFISRQAQYDNILCHTEPVEVWKRKVSYRIINIEAIANLFDDKAVINLNSLIEAKLISNNTTKVKVLAKNTGEEISKKFTFEELITSKTVQDLYSI